MKPIDMNTWARREIYGFFLPVSDPFYAVTFPLDVTNLCAYKRARGISFYMALCWLCAKAMNDVENFRYVSRGGAVYLHDERIPSFTDMRPGSDRFYYVTPPLIDDLDEYCRAAKAYSAAQDSFIDASLETDALIYISCIPQLAVVSQTFAHNFSDPGELENNIPRVSWGKYTQCGGRVTLNVTAEVNHRFVDGIHVARFADGLQRRIDLLRPETADALPPARK